MNHEYDGRVDHSQFSIVSHSLATSTYLQLQLSSTRQSFQSYNPPSLLLPSFALVPSFALAAINDERIPTSRLLTLEQGIHQPSAAETSHDSHHSLRIFYDFPLLFSGFALSSIPRRSIVDPVGLDLDPLRPTVIPPESFQDRTPELDLPYAIVRIASFAITPQNEWGHGW